jgi:hypothetical protein
VHFQTSLTHSISVWKMDRLWPWSSMLGFDASDSTTVLKSLVKMHFGVHSPIQSWFLKNAVKI